MPDDLPSRVFDCFIDVMVSYVRDGRKSLQYYVLFWRFEVFPISVFTVEYALRLSACTADERFGHPVMGRLRFALTPLVDLVAILPFY